jgi:DNA-binding response OmpR family regulator
MSHIRHIHAVVYRDMKKNRPIKKHILIAEDDRDYGELLQYLFQRRGFQTTLVADGDDAVGKMRELKPDLLVLDLMLPGLDGFEVCRLSKSAPGLCRIPIVMLTAMASREGCLKGFKVGADDYVTKPFQTDDLMARVHRALIGTLKGKLPSGANQPAFPIDETAQTFCGWCGKEIQGEDALAENGNGICSVCEAHLLADRSEVRV